MNVATRPAATVLGFLALGLAATACGPADESAAQRPAPQLRPTVLPRAAEKVSDGPALPARGRVLVLPSERGVRVLANEAPRWLVLQDLEREARFRVELADGVVLDGTLTLRAVDASLDEVLALLLDGLPYTVHYAVDPQTGARVLGRIHVGEDVAAGATAAAVQTLGDPPRPAREPRARRNDAEPAVRPVEDEWVKQERYAARQAQYLEELESPDPETRADAASFVRADPEAVPQLADLAAADPDPRVRAAAVETLGEADYSQAALGALIRALEDSDPEVVIASLDALEWIGDESLIPEIEFLLEHPHPEVRLRTIEAIEWFED